LSARHCEPKAKQSSIWQRSLEGLAKFNDHRGPFAVGAFVKAKAMIGIARPAALAGVLASFAALVSAAEDPARYPTQPIRMIVPFAPGGASDFTARLIEPGLSQFLGRRVIIENRPGAAGNIGMELAAVAAPNGYTIFLANIGVAAINPAMFPDLKVKPEKDFVGVTLVVITPGVLIAHPSFPPNSVKELVDYVRARPGKINFASPGSGSLYRLEMEQLRLEAGLDMMHIPYKGGAGPAVTEVLAGHVEMMMVTVSSAIAHIRSGRLKALAVSTAERLAVLPDVPTMVEQGFPKIVSSQWQALMVPAGTPHPIVDKLHAAIAHALSDQSVRDRMTAAGQIPTTSASPEEFKTFLAAETLKWAEVVKAVGAQPE
jgi:tripartite-type tricarboxylate transporter receptor subunit TctC